MRFIALLGVLLCAGGCGRFAAHRMMQAPNSYPKWLAPEAPVSLSFSDDILTAFTNRYLVVSEPEARLRYRVIEPANYDFHWSKGRDESTGQVEFRFSTDLRALNQRTNRWSAAPRGTLILLHGYGVAGFEMLPWALFLAERGWRSIVVDLRGHGRSTGKQIYFGLQEVRDLSALLDELNGKNKLTGPISVIGHSYGSVIALRWKMNEPRIDRVIAISPYANLTKAILNITHEYARWLPDSFITAGMRKLPKLLNAEPDDLNPETWPMPFDALIIAGGSDKIAPLDEVKRVCSSTGHGSELVIVPEAAHEPLPFYIDDLAKPILFWLAPDLKSQGTFFSNSSSQTVASESEGARQSPRGERDPPEPTFGPLGIAERLN